MDNLNQVDVTMSTLDCTGRLKIRINKTEIYKNNTDNKSWDMYILNS